MKKTLAAILALSLLAAVFGLTVSASDNGQDEIRGEGCTVLTKVETVGNGKTLRVEEYSHDEAGNRTKCFVKEWDGEKEALIAIYSNEFTFDESGNLLTVLSMTLSEESGKLENDYRQSFTYGEDNNLLTELFSVWNGTAFEDTLSAVYTYENGKLKELIYKVFDNGEWKNNEKTDYFCEKDGTETEITSIFDGRDFVPVSKSVFRYDEKGRLIDLINYSAGEEDPLDWVFYDETLFELTDSGLITKEIALVAGETPADEPILDGWFFFRYDEEERPVESEVYMRWEDDEVLPRERCEWSYTEKDGILTEIRTDYDWFGGKWNTIESRKREITKDEAGNKTKTVIFCRYEEEDEWQEEETEICTYEEFHWEIKKDGTCAACGKQIGPAEEFPAKTFCLAYAISVLVVGALVILIGRTAKPRKKK